MVRPISARLLLLIGLMIAAADAPAGETEMIGSKAVWPTEWTALPGANDPDDGHSANVDIVGNDTYPAAYFADDGEYVYFRMRVDFAGSVSTGNPPTFADAHLVLIDVVGSHWTEVANDPAGRLDNTSDDDYPDYSFAWDSKLSPQNHGLEMQVRDQTTEQWAGIRMDDLDGSSGDKLSTDINGAKDPDQSNPSYPGDYRSTDGYVRTIDGVATDTVANGGFDNTTFVDFAVAWSYLTLYTDLSQDQVWNVTFATIENANDHGALLDVAGAVDPLTGAPITDGWSEALPSGTTPVPASALLMLTGLGLFAAMRRFRRVVSNFHQG